MERHDIKFDRSKLRGKIVERYGTQIAFADAIGGSNQGVTGILKGSNNPRCETIAMWADALGISVDEIGEYFFTRA